MGILKKGNKKPEIKAAGEVIKNLAPSDFMFWQYPQTTFKSNSQLIVMPGEEALFIKNGNIDHVFENGTYYLTTETYSFLKRYTEGDVINYSCTVLFFRKSSSVEILWGTDSPIRVRDKVVGVATTIKARGAYRVSVADVGIFLEKLAGSRVDYLKQEDIKNYFRNELLSKIKSNIASAINNLDSELLGIDSRLDEISQSTKVLLNQSLVGYGLKCVSFSVSALDIDDSELRRRYDEIGMEGLAKVRNAQADKAVIDTLGEDWSRQQSVNLLNKTVDSMAGSTYVGGNPYAGLTGQLASSVTGNPPPDNLQKLTQLKSMLDAGLITAEEYEAKKAEILGRM